jgi:hypothetical protein
MKATPGASAVSNVGLLCRNNTTSRYDINYFGLTGGFMGSTALAMRLLLSVLSCPLQ